jgi:UDP-glucuronate 4-epimerase
VRPSLKDPVLYERVNCGGTTAVLELARLHGVKTFIFGSSSSIYGNNAKLPFSEEDNVDAPISPYAATKRAGELLCRCYHELYGMRVTCLRFFTVYGPRGRPDLAIYLFTEKMLRGEEITVFGDGSARRDFTFVQDIVDGVIAAADRALPFEIINLGESGTVSVNELVELISRATGAKPRIRTLPAQPGDVKTTYADIAKARRLLGYAPGYPIERGIPAFVEWYRKNIAGR